MSNTNGIEGLTEGDGVVASGDNTSITSLTFTGGFGPRPSPDQAPIPVQMSAVSLEQRLMALIDDLAGDANAVAEHMAHGGAERLDEEKVRGDVPRFALSPDLIGLARASSMRLPKADRDREAAQELSTWQRILGASPYYPVVNLERAGAGNQSGSVRYPQGTVTMGPTLGLDGLPIPGEPISFTTITPLQLVRFPKSPRPHLWQHPVTGDFWALGLETVDTIGRNPKFANTGGQPMTDEQLGENIGSTTNTSSAYVVFYKLPG